MALNDFYLLCVSWEENPYRHWGLSVCYRVPFLQQCVEVTNCSDRIPFYNITLGNKIPPRAVCQLSILRAVGSPFTETERYINGQTNNNTKLVPDSFLQVVRWCMLFCWCACICYVFLFHEREVRQWPLKNYNFITDGSNNDLWPCSVLVSQ